MYIEIKDLPEGREIKKITFDIEFEDGIPKKTDILGTKEDIVTPKKEQSIDPEIPKEMIIEEF